LSHPRRLTVILLFLLALGLLPFQAAAQERYTYSYLAGFSVGLGGTADAESDPGFDNFDWQAMFGMDLEKNLRFGARLGQMSLDTDGGSGNDLTYLTLVGEYLAPAPHYESGLYLGVGYYDFGAGGFFPGDSSLGLTLGVTAGFKMTDRLVLLLDLAGHYADLNYAQFFANANVGVAYRF